MTSNSYRDMSDALKRRCIHLYIDYPDTETELAIVRRARVLHQLREQGVELHCNAHIDAIDTDHVRYTQGEEQRRAAATQVIIAMGAEADESLSSQLADHSSSVHSIGDCRQVGYIDGAILDARRLVQQIG